MTRSRNSAARFGALPACGCRNTQSQLFSLEPYFDDNDYTNAVRQARQYARQAANPQIRQRWIDLIAAPTSTPSATTPASGPGSSASPTKNIQHWRRVGCEEPLDANVLAATSDYSTPDPRDGLLRS